MANNTEEKIVLGLDIPKSAAQINTDIKKLQKQVKQVKLSVELDDSLTRETGKLGNAVKEQLKQATDSVKRVLSLGSVVSFGISQAGKSMTELKNLDTILTQIGNTSNLTKGQLSELGDISFQTASKYGKSARDYLTSVQKMFQAGYKNPQEMSKLSLLAQSAGNMDSTTANNYLIASDAAYQLKGNIEELNKVIDGQNNITNHASVTMSDMALATSESAAMAARYGVQINELSALIAAANLVTHESGNQTGAALNGVFARLQDMSDQSVRQALDAVNISMTEFTNGSRTLKTPIQLLQELSTALAGLNENDTRRTNILSAISGEYNTDTLAAILDDWSSYKQMLDLYSQGMGSAATDAEKTANSWEGSLNRLSNTWNETIGNIANSDTIVTAINGLNGILSVLNKVTGSIGPAATIGAGAGLFAGLQNTGRYIRVYGS